MFLVFAWKTSCDHVRHGGSILYFSLLLVTDDKTFSLN